MKYRVLYIPEAEQSLEQIINGESRAKYLLRDTIRTINEKLVSKPYDFGESRDDDNHIGFDSPFAINYQILADVRTVIVVGIWRTDQR